MFPHAKSRQTESCDTVSGGAGDGKSRRSTCKGSTAPRKVVSVPSCVTHRFTETGYREHAAGRENGGASRPPPNEVCALQVM